MICTDCGRGAKPSFSTERECESCGAKLTGAFYHGPDSDGCVWHHDVETCLRIQAGTQVFLEAGAEPRPQLERRERHLRTVGRMETL